MRYLLLFAFLIGGSVMLPAVTMREPSGRANDPVNVATLPPEKPTAGAPAPTEEPTTDTLAEGRLTNEIAPPVEPKAAPVPLIAPALVLHIASAAPFGLLPRLFDRDSVAVVPPEIAVADAEAADLARLFDQRADALEPVEPPALAPTSEPEETASAEETVVPEPRMSDGIPLGQANKQTSEPLGPSGEAVGYLTLDGPTDPIVLARLPQAEDEESVPEGADDTSAVDAAEPASEADDPMRAADAEKPGQDMLKVTATALNMRAGPSSSHPVVTGLTRGALAEAIGEERNGWVPVRVPDSNMTGWVFSRYVAQAEGA